MNIKPPSKRSLDGAASQQPAFILPSVELVSGRSTTVKIPTMLDREKKAYEGRIIERARRLSTLIPKGKMVPSERPDWLIPSGSLGIEVSDLLPVKPIGARFSGPQISSFQEAVVSAAEKLYYTRSGALPAHVLVFYENDWTRKRDLQQAAEALAEFVRNNYPLGSEDCVTLEALSHGVRDWVEGLSRVRILRGKGTWEAAGAASIGWLSYDQIADRITSKGQRLPEYRRRRPGWRMWLLLPTRMRVLESVYIPREVRTWQFNADFDKVILCSWEGEVIDLQLGSS